MLKLCKFGGTSLATREQIEKSLDIMFSDDSRRIMVVSAPGARFKGDTKVTDLLIEFGKTHGEISYADNVLNRFREIIPENPGLIEEFSANLKDACSFSEDYAREDAVKSFGEYACAKIVEKILRKKGINAGFADPLDIGFRIVGEGSSSGPDSSCFRNVGRNLASRIETRRILVVPGFYGINERLNIATLPRGGSDTSGAVFSRAVHADVYENWTDEDGLRRADPRIVPDAEVIPEMTYDEARELAYMGFKLQDACFEPIKGHGIPLNVRNTNNPSHPGTMIVDSRQVGSEERIAGVACQRDKEGLVSIGMRKMYVDKEVGFGRKMMGVLEEMKIPYEHTLDGVDTASLVVARKYLSGNRLDALVLELKNACQPEAVMIQDFALLSAAGLGMKNHYDTHARVFFALAQEKIPVRMIDEGADDLSMFVGIDNERACDAVRAVYGEFFGKK